MTAFMPLAMEKDLRWDLMATGSGSLSMRWTGVHDTMALQQRSWRLKTEDREEENSHIHLVIMTLSPVRRL